MKVLLKHADLSDTYLQWDQKKGTLEGDTEIVRQINLVAEHIIKDGYIAYPDIPNIDYPITDPLKNKEELALLLAFLDYRSPDLPLPSLNLEFDANVVY